MSEILVVASDVVGLNMAGPGIRVWEFATALSRENQVTLAVPNKTDLTPPGFDLQTYDRQGQLLLGLIRRADVILVQGFVLHLFPFLKRADAPLVVDLYIPFLLESLEWHAGDYSTEWIAAYQEYLRVLNEQLRAGDFFLCATERQRDYYLGMLTALKRVNPHVYQDDRSLRHLIDVVPFGLPGEPPQPTRPVLKGVYPGISANDKVVLWGGGLWEWLDPLTPIRAVGQMARDDVRLFFLGTQHPDATVTREMHMTAQAIALSQELGLLGKCVFFNDWVPYADRGSYLLEADVGVSAHRKHAETRFAFRTRFLDYIWAGLPIVATRGDATSEMVERHGLGKTVACGDVEGFAAALSDILGHPDPRQVYQTNFAHLRNELTWDRAIKPLAAFCRAPRHAPDRGLYLTELERIVRDKEAFWQGIVQERDDRIVRLANERTELEATLQRYHRTLPFRVYFALKSLLRSVARS